MELFGRLQKRDLTKAILYAAETRPVRTVDDAVAVTKDLLGQLGKLAPGDLMEGERRASELREVTQLRFAETAAEA